jgi:hypothetical protein
MQDETSYAKSKKTGVIFRIAALLNAGERSFRCLRCASPSTLSNPRPTCIYIILMSRLTHSQCAHHIIYHHPHQSSLHIPKCFL